MMSAGHARFPSGPRTGLPATFLVALAVFGAVGGNGAARTAQDCGDPIEPGYVACPDLVLTDFSAYVSSDQLSVVLAGRATNSGRANSPPAVVRGFVARGKAVMKETTLRSLGPQEDAPVQVAVPIDDAMREQKVKVGLSLDPDEAIAEDDETNNSDAGSLAIPALLPDLTVEAVEAELANGNLVRVTFAIVNRGGAALASTALVEGDGSTRTVDVSPLARGERRPFVTTLSLSADPSGRTIGVAVTADARQDVVENDEGNNVGRTQLEVPAALANLVVTNLRAKVERSRVVIFATVRNSGDAPASAAEIVGTATGWRSETSVTTQLEPGAETTATLVFDIPNGKRGETSTLSVLVDAGSRVDELDEADNERSVDVFVPERPVVLPDLTLGPPTFALGEQELLVTMLVRNAGNGPAPETLVEARVAGRPPVTEIVSALVAGRSAEVELRVPVSEEDDGREVQVVLAVDPDDEVREQLETNNVRRAATLVELPERDSLTVEISVGLGVLGALVATFGGWSGVRIRRRHGWERRAVESEEPTECRSPKWCRKLTLEPKRWIRRRVAYLELSSQRDPQARRTVDGELVDSLNRAIKGYRRRGDPDDLRAALMPVAEGLVAEIERTWTGSDVDEIAVAGHLEGGKVSTKYERYECVDGKPKKVEEWERDFEDQVDEMLATVRYPISGGPARSTGAAELLAALRAFCTGRVDVPPARVPHAPAVPGS